MADSLRLIVERIDACTALHPLLTQQDRAAAADLRPERRRAEFLAWRALVRREAGAVGIGYAPWGAPQLDDGRRLSVAHCDRYVAVLIADGPCGVDIERLDRAFGRAAERYAAPHELALSADPRLPAALWCGKEALYKFAGRRGIRLKRDLAIGAVDFEAGRMTGSVCGSVAITIRFRIFDGHLLAWVG